MYFLQEWHQPHSDDEDDDEDDEEDEDEDDDDDDYDDDDDDSNWEAKVRRGKRVSKKRKRPTAVKRKRVVSFFNFVVTYLILLKLFINPLV